MSAPNCIIYYGLRYDIPATELEELEARTDARIAAAHKAGLKFYWGKVGSPDNRYLLFIGDTVGVMGPENQTEVQLSAEQFETLAASVSAKLKTARLEGSPKLHIQWQDDD